MSTRPLVALTTSWDENAGPHQRPRVQVYGAYVSALEDAGLATVLISPAHSPESIEALLQACGGLVLHGWWRRRSGPLWRGAAAGTGLGVGGAR